MRLCTPRCLISPGGQAEVIDSYNGIDIPEGDKLVQFHISVTNTSDSGFLIFKDDFQLQWGDGDSDFGVGFDAVDDDMLSEVTGVSRGPRWKATFWLLSRRTPRP